MGWVVFGCDTYPFFLHRCFVRKTRQFLFWIGNQQGTEEDLGMEVTKDDTPKYAYGYGWETQWDFLPETPTNSNKPPKIHPTTSREWGEIFNAGYL
jgi:hypothetical protein